MSASFQRVMVDKDSCKYETVDDCYSIYDINYSLTNQCSNGFMRYNQVKIGTKKHINLQNRALAFMQLGN